MKIKSIIQGMLKKKNLNIDKEFALQYLGNIERLYYKTNTSFVFENHNVVNEINNLLKEKNYYNIYLIIHRIKGFAYYLGSKELYEFCSYLCINMNQKKYDESEIVLFCEFLKELISYKIQENNKYYKKNDKRI